MSSEFANIFDAALGLSEDARASLAFRLLQSLKPPIVFDASDARLEEELERRVADYEAGKVGASTWGEVNARLREALPCGKQS